MHLFWKKVNRGLLLGGVLLLGLIVMIVVHNLRFSMEKDDILKISEDYVQTMLNFNQLSKNATVGEKLTDAQKQAELDALNAAFAKNWYEGESDIRSSFCSSTDLRLKLVERHANELTCVPTDVKGIINRSGCTVTQDGPNRALCTVSLLDLNATVYGDGSLFGLVEGGVYYEGDIEDSALAVSYYGSYTFELERVNGEWKIVSVLLSNSWISSTESLEEVQK